MELGLRQKRILVSGSSRGIGLAIARGFLLEGARVILTGRNPASLESSRSALGAEFGNEAITAHAGDMTNPGVIAATLSLGEETFGGIDSVIANIGDGSGTKGWDLTATDWKNGIADNLVAGMLLASASVPYLKRQKSGSITFVSSIAGCEAIPAPIPYSAAKAALQHGAKNLARQLGGEGIRVNTVAPGNVLFPGGVWDRKRQEDSAAVDRYISAEVPLGRFADPSEIADAVMFLTSDRAAFITGSLLVIDGGQTRC